MAFILSKAKGGLDNVTGKTKLEEEKKKTQTIETQLKDAKEDLAEEKEKNKKLTEHIEHLEMELSNERAMRMDAQKNLQVKLDEEQEAKDAAGKAEENKKLAAERLAKADENAKKQALLDAQKAYEATSGLTTKEVKLSESICLHPYAQAQILRQTYLSNYGKDLYKRVKSCTDGHLRTLLLGALDGPMVYECQVLHDAMSGLTTNEMQVINIICPSTNAHLKELKAKFTELFQKDLVEKVSKSTGGDVQKLLVALLQCTRDETDKVDAAVVSADANALYAAGEGKTIGHDAQPFISILTQRNSAHINAVNAAYKKTNKKERDLVTAIDHVFGGSLLQCLSVMVAFHVDAAAYFCAVAENAMKGIGCDSNTLIDMLIRRREIDMDKVKKIYATGDHQRPFSERVLEELGGDVGKAATMLLGEYKPTA